MKKDAYYFPHFSNARNDAKLLKLRRVLGLEGYGIFFCLLEILRDQTEFKYPLDGLPELEFELRVPKEKISTVIMDYDLFEVDQENKFFSPKMILYLAPYLERTSIARKAALKRWKGISDAHALLEHSPSSGQAMQGEERRGEESKGEESKEEDNVVGFQKKSYKQTIDERKIEFQKKLEPYVEKYGRDMMNAFYRHWTQINEGGKKMWFERQKVWDLPKRLATWKKNDERFAPPKKQESQPPQIKLSQPKPIRPA